MVLTAAQTTTFWTNAQTGMAVPVETIPWLQEQGINGPDDLVHWNEEMLDDVRHRASKTQWVTILAAGGQPEQTEQRAPPTLNPLSFYRLKCTLKAVKFWETVGRPLTATMLRWSTIKRASDELSAFESKEADEVPKLKKLSMTLTYIDELSNYLGTLKSSRDDLKAPLAYVIRDEAVVPAAAPDLATNAPYSDEHGSCVDELTARTSHDHHMFNVDNREVFEVIMSGLRGTILEGTISSFEVAHDGRRAWMALVSQHAGETKWKLMIKVAEDKLASTIFTGTNPNYTFEKHANFLRQMMSNMEKAVKHVPYQLYNDVTKCSKIFASVAQCNDPIFLSSVAECKKDPAKNTNFEAMLAFLVQFCPVANNKRLNKKRPAAHVSSVAGDFGDKGTHGPETGVEIRYYKPEEYHNLTADQQQELRQIRDEKQKNGGTRNLTPKKTKVRFEKNKKKGLGAEATKKLIVSEVAKLKQVEEKQQATNVNVDAIVAALTKALEPPQNPKPSLKPTISTTEIMNRIKRKQGQIE